VDKNDQFQLEKVTLGDMDCALKLEDQKLLNQRMGNVMWRSPEGQLGKGVGKPSEVFSFGLLVSLRLRPQSKELDSFLAISVSMSSLVSNVSTRTSMNSRLSPSQ
jgi:hypothetical protein